MFTARFFVTETPLAQRTAPFSVSPLPNPSTRTPAFSPFAKGRSTRRSFSRTTIVGSVLALGAALTACGQTESATSVRPTGHPTTGGSPSTSSPSTDYRQRASRGLVVGHRSPTLDFSVAPDKTAAPPTKDPGSPRASVGAVYGATSALKAADGLLRGLINRDGNAVWSMLSAADRTKVGYPQRLIDEAYSAGWEAYRITSTSASTFTVEVEQTAKVSDIDGVIAQTATMTVPVTFDGSRFFVGWTRRLVVQHYPDRTAATDRAVENTVMAWASARQKCTPAPHEYPGGLFGVIGLATSLCHTSTSPKVQRIDDLDSLDEPQPFIDGFGGSALIWARVATLSTPVPMNVVVAPNGSEWTVLGIARPSLASS